ncbi:MAG: restriction endonuclease subunit S [Candidatus Saccharimonas aalborgensis]
MTPKLRFPKFSGEWEPRKLGDLDIYVSDGNYGEMYPKTSEMKDSGVAFIRANNLKDGKLTWQDMRYIDLDLHKVLKSGHLKTGDTLVTTRGDVGITAYVTEEFDNANINAQICLLRTGDDLAKQYLFYSLQTAKSKNQFTQLQTGSALKQLPKGKLALLVIGVPSKDEQEKIAGFLTVVDERVAAMSKKVELLQRYKKDVMQKIFSQKLRFKDEDGQNYSDWQGKKLGDLVIEIADGGTPDTSNKEYFGGSINWVVIDDIQDVIERTKTTLSEKGLQGSSAKLWPKGTVILSTGATIGEVGIAKVAVATKQGIVGIDLNKSLADNRYIKFWLQRHRATLLRYAQGSSIKEIRAPELKKLKIITPGLKEQQKIADFLTSLDDKINLEKIKLDQAKLFKKSLLQRMFV